jgi:3-oxoacyl-[acyl-carrier-protein] synthase III
MSGNATFRSSNATILAVSAIDAPIIVTSAQIDERLAGAYARVGLRPGLIEGMAGIRERRWWSEGSSFVEGAALTPSGLG